MLSIPTRAKVMSTNTKKAIGYIRVSTDKQASEGVSLEAQAAKIRAWAELNDYELVAIHADEGISGASMGKRAGLQKALKDAKRGMAVVCYSLSRLSRSVEDTLAISRQLDAGGIDLVSLSEKIDTTGAAGRMIFNMLAVLSQFERDQIAERTQSALRHKKATGKVYSPTHPPSHQRRSQRTHPPSHHPRLLHHLRPTRPYLHPHQASPISSPPLSATATVTCPASPPLPSTTVKSSSSGPSTTTSPTP